MCGIVGYIGDREAQGILLKSLSRLEYRGYDSAGLAVIKGKKMGLVKKKGKLGILAADLKAEPLKGSTGIGHCLTADTLVYLADGRIVPIASIRDGQEVYAFNIENFHLEPAKVKVLQHVSPEHLYQLHTSFATVKCTGNHKMFVVSNGKVVEKKAEALRAGDELIIPKITQTNGRGIRFKKIFAKRYAKMTPIANRLIRDSIKQQELSVPQCAVLSGMSEAYIGHVINNDRNFREDRIDDLLSALSLELKPRYFIPQNTIHGKYINLPEQSSPDLMRIIGYLLGDGTVKERCIRFKDADEAVLHFYNGLIKKVFNVKGRVVSLKEANAWLLEVNSLYLCEWLRTNVVTRQNEFLSTLGQVSKEEAAAFLMGIFDAEGCVHAKSGQISLRLTNETIVKISQILLLSLGITASFYTEKKRVKNWNNSHGIFISNVRSFKIFKSLIGFRSSIKYEKLLILASRKSGKSKEGQEDSNIIRRPILDIKKIRSDETILFDLEVEHSSASFVANGIVSHNSRWATHGVPSDINAHPHLDCKGKIAVAHNGIVENYLELKKRLQKEGHKFVSETDTEVIAHLIEKFYSGNIAEAVRKAVKVLRGSYAIAVIHRDEPSKLVGARCDSPLIVGIGRGENFLASDVPAVLDHTKEVIYLDNHEIVVLTKENIIIKDLEGRRVDRKPSKITWDISRAEKDGYKHFMLKEIFEQSHIIGNIIDERCKGDRISFEELKISDGELKKVKRIVIAACGTAYHAGLTGKYMLEEYARIPCWVDVSSEFRYRDPLVGRDTLMIVISQSGETADTLAALREAKRHGAKILAICNVLGNSIARESDGVIYTHAGPEIAVASTKAYTAQLAVFYLLTLYLANLRKTVARAKLKTLLKELRRVPGLMEELLVEYEPEYNLLAAYAEGFKKYYHEKHNKTFFLYLARNINYPNALEGALKLKEIAYISAEGYPAGEMKHGPIALIDENPWVVCIAVKSGTYDKMISNIQEIKARNGIVIAISTEGDKEILHHNINYLIEIPRVDEFFSPLLVAIPLQLLAYYVARAFGYDIDQPRNLAKSVTVE